MDRPTFSEHWHRVSRLTPRLRSDAGATRQRSRSERWWIVRDPATNTFVRVSEPAWGFVALLDGRRTVGEAWDIACERFDDDAPTQGEAIQALAQLYASNLLISDLPGDAKALFERSAQRRRRELTRGAMSFLFVRIPLIDPNEFLGKWERLAGLAFTWVGLIIWSLLMLLAIGALASEWDRFTSGVWGVLESGNLVWLYIAIAFAKLLHELGHGFASRHFGRIEGTAGEVHTLGIMFLVLVPLPYVDASSAWALRSKWRRAAVGAAGMYIELAVAAIAAIVWSRTGAGAVNAVAYNLVFAAGVTTILFNANPLLRYDGYYILSDLLEIPNLQQRASRELHHWVKRLIWGVRTGFGVSRSTGERAMLLIYALLSGPYRIFVGLAIALFVAETLPFVGIAIALAVIVLFIGVPLGKFVSYLMTNAEIQRERGRALATTLILFVALSAGLMLIPAPRWVTLEGEVDARERASIYPSEGGFVTWVLASDRSVEAGNNLFRLNNRALQEELAAARAELSGAQSEYDRALAEDAAQATIVAPTVRALDDRVSSLEDRLARLTITAPNDGVWLAPLLEHAEDAYVRRADEVGEVVAPPPYILRSRIPQSDVGAISETFARDGAVRITARLRADPGELITGHLVEIAPAGDIEGEERTGGLKGERRFAVVVEIDGETSESARVGMSVRLRVHLDPEPLGVQWSRRFWQLLQRRLGGEVG